MVYGVCLRVLGHHQDAEDAFQATFLMLVRKGKSIRRRKCISAWLYRVAYRLALTQRARVKNRVPEALSEFVGAIEPVDPAWLELRSALDEEVQRLPGHYRSVLVLCALEGKSYEAAADQLGCPRGTVAVRLLRAREMLKKRLVRRGLIGAAASLTAQTALPQAMAIVPPTLTTSTAAAAMALSSGAGLLTASVGAASLVRAAAREYWRERCRLALVALAVIGVLGAGASGGAQARFGGHWSEKSTSTAAANRNFAGQNTPSVNARAIDQQNRQQPAPRPGNAPAGNIQLVPSTE
jgi:RNA polymerase sigma factor (sigma-70 family)